MTFLWTWWKKPFGKKSWAVSAWIFIQRPPSCKCDSNPLVLLEKEWHAAAMCLLSGPLTTGTILGSSNSNSNMQVHAKPNGVSSTLLLLTGMASVRAPLHGTLQHLQYLLHHPLWLCNCSYHWNTIEIRFLVALARILVTTFRASFSVEYHTEHGTYLIYVLSVWLGEVHMESSLSITAGCLPLWEGVHKSSLLSLAFLSCSLFPSKWHSEPVSPI